MKRITIFKLTALAVVFFVSFIGINIAKERSSLNGQASALTVVSLASQSLAYCNEATFQGEVNDGCCDGQFNAVGSRCTKKTTPGAGECVSPIN